MLKLLVGATAAFMALASFPHSASATGPGVVRQAPAVYRFTIGDAQVTALSDGTIPLDLHKLLRGISPAETDTLLARSFLTNPVQPSINIFLIEMEGHTTLVDTGAGDSFGPGNGGRLPEALTAAGIRPEQIGDVLLTHAHPDHSGGLVRNGQILFPSATVHLGKPDLDFYLDSSHATGSDRERHVFDHVRSMLKPYVDTGKVRAFEQPGQVVPGISGELRPGHSPGSVFYTLESRGEKLVFIGDVIHVAAVDLPRPSVTMILDQDPSKARAVREQAFSEFARSGILIAAPHMSFPGIGHMRVDGNGYRWFAAEYANRDPRLPDLAF